MSHCLILQHDDTFGPGRLIRVFRDFGVPTVTRKMHVDNELDPDELDETRVLVLLGGTGRVGGVEDDYGKSLPSLQAEVDVVKQFVEADRPVIGFGLGAQILALAAGAEVRPITVDEDGDGRPDAHLGWNPITLPFPGGTDPILFGFGDGAPMFFWQRDTFTLPKLPPPTGYDPDKPGPPPPTGNALLSSTRWDKNAAFRFKNRLYGFAYQPELDAESVLALLESQRGAVGAAHGSGAYDRAIAETHKHRDRFDRLGDRLIGQYIQFLHAYDPPM